MTRPATGRLSCGNRDLLDRCALQMRLAGMGMGGSMSAMGSPSGSAVRLSKGFEELRAKLAAAESSSDKLREGDKVEARCKGSKKHYPGKIFMDNRDGTYDVKFDDGDRDREVPKSSISRFLMFRVVIESLFLSNAVTLKSPHLKWVAPKPFI